MCFMEEKPDAGRIFSFVENTIISKSPDQKIGIASPNMPRAVIIESIKVFFFRAAITPKVMPKIMAMTRAPPASLIVVGKTLSKASDTDLPE